MQHHNLKDTLAEAASYVTTIHLIRSGKTATITRDTIKAVRNEPTGMLFASQLVLRARPPSCALISQHTEGRSGDAHGYVTTWNVQKSCDKK